jgi:hypothetical protein
MPRLADERVTYISHRAYRLLTAIFRGCAAERYIRRYRSSLPIPRHGLEGSWSSR